MLNDTDIDVATLHRWRQSGRTVTVLDVREPWETELCALPDSLFIPLGHLPDRVAEIPVDRPVVVLCHHGVRSGQAAVWLRRRGLAQAINLAGGIDAWARLVDTEMEVY